MEMKLTQRVLGMSQSLPRLIFDMAKSIGGDVIDLTLGDPDVHPPENVRRAAAQAIMDSRSRYSQNAGIREAREAIAAYQRRICGRDEVTADDIIITVGAMGSIFQQLFSLVEEGDEVIIPAPFWVNYQEVTKLCGARPVIVSSSEKNGFSVTAEEIAAAVTPRSKVLVVNSPGNPSGRVMKESVVRELARLAIEKDLFVISDECYRSLVYDGIQYRSIFDEPGMKGRCSVIDAMSKQFSLTGYRVGYTIGPRRLVETMTKLQENLNACAPTPLQHAAIEAYSERTDTSYLKSEYDRRRHVVLNGIQRIPKLTVGGVDAGFYAFVNISRTGMKSMDFAKGLLLQERIAVVPGIAYGDAYDDFIRIAFTVSEAKLEEAFKRIDRFIRGGCGAAKE